MKIQQLSLQMLAFIDIMTIQCLSVPNLTLCIMEIIEIWCLLKTQYWLKCTDGGIWYWGWSQTTMYSRIIEIVCISQILYDHTRRTIFISLFETITQCNISIYPHIILYSIEKQSSNGWFICKRSFFFLDNTNQIYDIVSS